MKKANLRRFKRRLEELNERFSKKEITYHKVYEIIQGWLAYAKQADTHKLRMIIAQKIGQRFQYKIRMLS